MDVSLFGFRVKYGIDGFRGGFLFSAGHFKHQSLTVVSPAADHITLSNEGAQGFFLSLKTTLRFGHLTFEPSLLYGEGHWDNGNLYYFFGKPKISGLWIYGVSFRLDPNDRFSSYDRRLGHELGFNLLKADTAIFNNEDVVLFKSPLRAALLFYGMSLEREKMSLSGRLGWLHASIPLSGELSASNQNYFLFPYLFYRVNGSLDILAGFAHLGFRYEHSIFRYDIGLGAIHVFSEKSEFDIHYQQKRLFGGKEGFEEFHPELGGIGAAFLLLEAGLPALLLGANRNTRLSLGLEKAFFLPWGYEKLFPSDTVSIGNASAASTIKTALLSGLSFRGSLRW
jgi:hypothetical protein